MLKNPTVSRTADCPESTKYYTGREKKRPNSVWGNQGRLLGEVTLDLSLKD